MTQEHAFQALDARPTDSMQLRELLLEDFLTHESDLTSPGFWALAVHRMGGRIDRVGTKAVRKPLTVAHKLMSTGVDWVWGIRIPAHTRVGRRVRIWHFGSLLLNARSIGNDVHIRHATTLGPLRSIHQTTLEALPCIEDDVDIGSGACIMGNIEVGHGARIGANTVVVEPVPPGVTVFGVPSRVIPS